MEQTCSTCNHLRHNAPRRPNGPICQASRGRVYVKDVHQACFTGRYKAKQPESQPTEQPAEQPCAWAE